MKLVNAPARYFELFTDWPGDVVIDDSDSLINFIHYFKTYAVLLVQTLPPLRKQLVPDGTIWVSWYKKSAKQSTNITEDTIRDFALTIGLFDVKVCAVDEQWSGLKLVIPVKERRVCKR